MKTQSLNLAYPFPASGNGTDGLTACLTGPRLGPLSAAWPIQLLAWRIANEAGEDHQGGCHARGPHLVSSPPAQDPDPLPPVILASQPCPPLPIQPSRTWTPYEDGVSIVHTTFARVLYSGITRLRPPLAPVPIRFPR